MLKIEKGAPIPVSHKNIGAKLAAVLPNRLGINYVTQKPYLNLCWAACCQMVLGARLSVAHTLCAIAGKNFNRQCCPEPRAAGCDCPEYPYASYVNLGFAVRRQGGRLSPEEIGDNIIQEHLPVQIYIEVGGGAHTAVVVDIVDGGFRIYDPLKGGLSCSYEYMEAGYTIGGRWTDTFYHMGVDPAIA